MSDVWNTDGSARPRPGYGPQEQVDPQGDALPAQGGPAFSPATQRKSSAVTLLIVAGLSSVFGCFLAIPAAILGILAVVNQGESPSRSAKFTRCLRHGRDIVGSRRCCPHGDCRCCRHWEQLT